MNYQKIYDDLMRSRMEMKPFRKIEKENGVYFERHHIMPKSKGGNYFQYNLVLLTAREHFLAHWLLWRIYRDRASSLAFHKMMSCNKKQKRVCSSRAYQEAREAFSETNKGNTYGKGNKGLVRQRGYKRPEHSLKMSAQNNHFFGKQHTEESRHKISIRAKERYLNTISYTSKPVLDLSTGVFYNSIKEAAVYYRMHRTTMQNMLSGKTENKTNLMKV